MGMFRNAVEKMARAIANRDNDKHIDAKDIPKIIFDALGGENNINCYPGNPCGYCSDLAFFVSFTSTKYKRPRDRYHLSCNQAMECLVRHMQGICRGQTKNAILITDNWDAAAFYRWGSNLSTIRSESNLEIYLLNAEAVTEIEIP